LTSEKLFFIEDADSDKRGVSCMSSSESPSTLRDCNGFGAFEEISTGRIDPHQVSFLFPSSIAA